MLGSLWPNLRGHDLKTHPQMDGDRFINTTDPIDTGKGNAAGLPLDLGGDQVGVAHPAPS